MSVRYFFIDDVALVGWHTNRDHTIRHNKGWGFTLTNFSGNSKSFRCDNFRRNQPELVSVMKGNLRCKPKGGKGATMEANEKTGQSKKGDGKLGSSADEAVPDGGLDEHPIVNSKPIHPSAKIENSFFHNASAIQLTNGMNLSIQSWLPLDSLRGSQFRGYDEKQFQFRPSSMVSIGEGDGFYGNLAQPPHQLPVAYSGNSIQVALGYDHNVDTAPKFKGESTLVNASLAMPPKNAMCGQDIISFQSALSSCNTEKGTVDHVSAHEEVIDDPPRSDKPQSHSNDNKMNWSLESTIAGSAVTHHVVKSSNGKQTSSKKRRHKRPAMDIETKEVIENSSGNPASTKKRGQKRSARNKESAKVDEVIRESSKRSRLKNTTTQSKREEKKPHAVELDPFSNLPLLAKTLSKETPSPSKLCKVKIGLDSIIVQSSYPHAPMGQVWLETSLSSSKSRKNTDVDLNSGGTLIGRRWVWDEGYFADGHLDTGLQGIRHLLGNKESRKYPTPRIIIKGCSCGAKHETVTPATLKKSASSLSDNGRQRRSERSGTSARMSSVISQLADGKLSPHTLIACEDYSFGPEMRFLKDTEKDNVQPFSVRISPDATFLTDLHAHLCDSEIIGFLGGRYSAKEKCIYIQGAFPCKSTDRSDSGQTDVEMDPVSQIYAREAIDNHGMSVVGWYHSHPTFQPDPSVTDIENQANYQQLFKSSFNDDTSSASSSSKTGSVCPFVGLIVGTYDNRNPTSQSVMRWFHVTDKEAGVVRSVHFPMNLKVTHRHLRKLDESELRAEMTLRGEDIRNDIESRYASCPITNSSPVMQGSSNQAMADGATKLVGQAVNANGEVAGNDQTCNDQTCNDQPIGDSNQSHVSAEGTTLLSEDLFDQTETNDTKWKYQSAQPLYFTDLEKTILGGSDETIPFDVMGGVIWVAVEREQKHVTAKGESNSLDAPASSRAILELLLRQSLTSYDVLDRKIYDMIHCLEDNESYIIDNQVVFNESDAIVFHNVDAVLSHYASQSKRISPFATWSGAGDKGNISKDSSAGSLSASDDDAFWRDFYLTNVLQMERVKTNGGKVYQGGIKMRRGHKMAACLLKWARHMQLNSVRCEIAGFDVDSCRRDISLTFDHEREMCGELHMGETKEPRLNAHVYFVAEVMRLLAARWREAKSMPSAASPKRRVGR